MRYPTVSLLLFAVACASSRATLPRSATVFIAPPVSSPLVDSELSRALVAEFDRNLRLGTDMVQVGEREHADYVIQTVVSFAAVKVTESQFDGGFLSVLWDETLVASVILTSRADPTNPVVVRVQGSPRESGEFASWVPLPVLVRSLKGCRVDATSGAMTKSDGSPAWLPGITKVEGSGRNVWRDLGLPTKQIPWDEDLLAFGGDPGWAEFSSLVDVLTTSNRIHGGPGPMHQYLSWTRLRLVLFSLAQRERMRNEVMDEADRRNLSALLERIAQHVRDDDQWGQEWEPASYAQLCAWLVSRMRDDHDAFRSGYKRLLAKNIEPEFCKAVYERWPPDPDLFGPLG